jgi:ATP-dependent DNA ligase
MLPDRIQLVEQWFDGLFEGPLAAEPKIDGVRCQIVVDPMRGRTWPRLRRGAVPIAKKVEHLCRTLLRACRRVPDLTSPVVFDGELQAGDWRTTISILNRRDPDPARERTLVFHVFDMRIKGGDDSLEIRRKGLVKVLRKCRNKRIKVVDQTIVSSKKALNDICKWHLDHGYEGTVVKRLGSAYGDFGCWMKIKPNRTVSGRIAKLTSSGAIVALCRRDGDREVRVEGKLNGLDLWDLVELRFEHDKYSVLRQLPVAH